jgi:phosphoenolpyruvate synthase/pyruvate phosphate dikinase
MKHKQKLTLVKEHSRPYSLFQVSAYIDVIKELNKEIDFMPKNELHFYKPEHGLVDIYHEPKELKALFDSIEKRCQDEKFVRKVLKEFDKSTEKSVPYLKGEKTVNSLEELKELYDLFISFYFGIAYAWVLPILENLPLDIREQGMKARVKTEMYSSERDKVFDINLGMLYPEMGRLVHFLHPKEVFGRQDTELLIELAKEREKGYIYYGGKIYSGDLLKNFLTSNNIELVDTLEKIDPKETEIEGTIAHKGIVRGTVKTVYGAKDIQKIKDGDVLVSPMTRPEFLPAMKKASAFVTDEGGITCHAAIVARELKKPCIIGTRIATKVLKDGDLVEVNADEGVVRKIKRKGF